jgi:DNA-binding transcriptional ArsR family regulator
VVYAAADIKAPVAVVERLAKALAHPLRVKILVELNQRVMSPSQFFNEFGGGSLTKVARHFRQLERYGCVEVVEEKSGGRRRGAVEHFFRATQRSLFDESSWTSLPESVKNEVTSEIFETYMERVTQAMAAGTIDARDERHFSWTALLLDQKAWEALIPKMDELFRFSLELGVEAGLRMVESGEEPIPVTVALAAFESPPAQSP